MYYSMAKNSEKARHFPEIKQTVPKWPSQLLIPHPSPKPPFVYYTKHWKAHHKHTMLVVPDLLTQTQVKPRQCFFSSQTLKYMHIFSVPWVFYLALSPFISCLGVCAYSKGCQKVSRQNKLCCKKTKDIKLQTPCSCNKYFLLKINIL